MTTEKQKQRMEEAYRTLKESDEHDYQRVVYEVPFGDGWNDHTGYVAEGAIGDETLVKVVHEKGMDTIPFRRVIRIHTVHPDNDED